MDGNIRIPLERIWNCLTFGSLILRRYLFPRVRDTSDPGARFSKDPVSYFEIEVSRKVGCVLTSNEVHFVSLAENVTV